jgi:protocatechuate 3,4-dioxygenase beta subunit
VTEGPYWVEEKLFRSDIRTDPTTNVTLAITVVNSTGGNCVPLTNAWVDIWHCDAIGIYSDEPTYNPGGGTGNVNTKGQKFLRGYQVTTVYPGWYASRTIHIHVRIRTFSDSSYTTALSNYTTQIFFDDSVTNTVLTQAPYSTRTSPRDTTNSNDSVYNGAVNKQTMLAPLTQTAAGYSAAITIDASLLAATATAFPAITAGGVLNAASGAAGVTPGAWITIYGTNLASTTYTMQSSDVSAGYLPSQLQGVSVQIDGKAAFIDYVSPTQLRCLSA